MAWSTHVKVGGKGCRGDLLRESQPTSQQHPEIADGGAGGGDGGAAGGGGDERRTRESVVHP